MSSESWLLRRVAAAVVVDLLVPCGGAAFGSEVEDVPYLLEGSVVSRVLAWIGRRLFPWRKDAKPGFFRRRKTAALAAAAEEVDA